MTKAEYVFSYLLSLYGAQFARINGHLYGEIYEEWEIFVNGMCAAEINLKLANALKLYKADIESCNCMRIPNLDDFKRI